jgi:hypothetical protein
VGEQATATEGACCVLLGCVSCSRGGDGGGGSGSELRSLDTERGRGLRKGPFGAALRERRRRASSARNPGDGEGRRCLLGEGCGQQRGVHTVDSLDREGIQGESGEQVFSAPRP